VARAEIHVWLVNVDDDTATRRAARYLPPAERDRLGARAQPHRRRALCAHAALRILAAAASTGALPLPELAADARGKPVLDAWGRQEGGTRGAAEADTYRLQVSLSHAGAYAAVALSTAGPVGVDIEGTPPLPDRERFARGILSAAEYDDWRRVPEEDRDTAVMRAFTRKEALLKALGTGLAGGLRQVATELDAPPGGRVRVREVPGGAGRPGEWSVLDLDGVPGLRGAVAVRASAAAVREHRTTIAELLRAAPPPPGHRAPARPRVPPGHRVPTRTRGDRPMHSTPLAHDPAASAASGLDDAAPTAGLQIFCLPHAGGNSMHFRAWNWLAPYARVVPVDLPGHGSRLREPLVQDWDRLAGDLTATIAAQVDGPYVLFGHSLGSLLAFDVSHRMLSRGLPPALLVAAGRNGPSAAPAYRPIHELPDARFIGALHKLGGMPEGLLHQTELLQMFLPVLRADLRLAERYARPPAPALPLPIMAFAGGADPMTDDLGMLAWKQETTSTCELVFLDGGHFFLDRPEFAGALTERIARLSYPVTVG
jgi:medium-chain acyl-[acyl-carrier-protein] hydrolase